MNDFINYKEPAIQEIKLPGVSPNNSVKVLVRREDQNNNLVSGNKWWKLKYNLKHAQSIGCNSVLTFGGAYSNHIYATAAACHQLGIQSIGIIRGEEVENETLSFAKEMGMKLRFISREEYRRKTEPGFLAQLRNEYNNSFVIPEGGTNEFAVNGTEELGKKILEAEVDYLLIPVGTGGTMAGIINAFDGKRNIIGVPILKDGQFLEVEIQKFLKRDYANWKLECDYHHGGYAKTNNALNDYIKLLMEQNIPTEFVYTGKLFWAARELINKEIIPAGSIILLLHTGGLRNH